MFSSKMAGIPRKEGDLGAILSSMTASIQQAMTSLYHLESVTRDPSSKIPPHWRYNYKQVRNDLKEQWEATIDLLRQCHSFGGDVPHLKKALTSSSKKNVRHFLEDMASKCKKCIEIAEELIKSCIVVSSTLRSHLDQSEPIVDPNQPYSNFTPNYLVGGSSDAPSTGHAQRSRVSNPPFEVIKGSIEEAGNGFESSTRNIRQQMEALSNFLKRQSEICAQCLIGLENPTQALKPDDIRGLATQWEGYQVDIDRSISSISRVCDAIRIEAIGRVHAADGAQEVDLEEDDGNAGDRGSGPVVSKSAIVLRVCGFLATTGILYYLILIISKRVSARPTLTYLAAECRRALNLIGLVPDAHLP